jgi:L-alanine-DL-glutamate epimerase-like enolase superfamily enzyme
MRLEVAAETFPLARAFTISRGSRTEAQVLTVTVEADGARGRGECVPYARYGETPASVTAAIEGLPPVFDRDSLQRLLPPGAARNAVDCALWDLEAKLAGRPVWELAGLAQPGPEITAFTLSLDTPEAMRAEAAKHAHRPLLKIKLGGAGDLARLEAVRAGAPAARIIVDANEGWTAESYAALAPDLVALGVELVEQPLPAGRDDALAEMARPLPVCADESCHDRASLAGLAGKYDVVNIKLDKTGGLTEALALRDAARAATRRWRCWPGSGWRRRRPCAG